MERDWLVKDVELFIQLIDDLCYQVQDDGIYKLFEEQVWVIFDLCLQWLMVFGCDEIDDELKKIGVEILDFFDILCLCVCIQEIVCIEMLEIKDEFVMLCWMEIVEGGVDFDEEDLIQWEDMVVIVFYGGYIKWVFLVIYWVQCWGGKGWLGMVIKEEDFVICLFVVNMYMLVLFFFLCGICYKMKVWCLLFGGLILCGKVLVNMLFLEQGEQIIFILLLLEDEDIWVNFDVMFVMVCGIVCWNKLFDFVNINWNGKIVMKLEDGDGIVGVDICFEYFDVMLIINLGQCICFFVIDVCVFVGWNLVGVCGICFVEGDWIILMQIFYYIDVDVEEWVVYFKFFCVMCGEVDENVGGGDEDGVVVGEFLQECYVEMSVVEQIILMIFENGYGKWMLFFEYWVIGCGGKGIMVMVVNDCNGGLIVLFLVEDSYQIMLVIDGG